jgi:hypothetical protein
MGDGAGAIRSKIGREYPGLLRANEVRPVIAVMLADEVQP